MSNNVINPVGMWSSEIEYKFLDLISYNGSSFLAKKDIPVGTVTMDNEYWMLVAQRGERGPAGIQGEQGLRGQQGVQGFQGIQGIAGPQGVQGLQGGGSSNLNPENNLDKYVTNDDLQEAIELLELDLNQHGINIKKNGLVGDGVTDDSIALQNLINKTRQEVINSNFKANNVILIPAGRYRLENQVIMSPFVKLKSLGMVIFETYVENNSALWITAQVDDPDFLHIIKKQQWLKSPLINGINGGITFVNRLPKNTSNSTAIEFGSRVDLTYTRPVSRYSVIDVCIEDYNIGFRMNCFRHYLGTFENIHMELNNISVAFGNEGQLVLDSGENFSFHKCVFAGSEAVIKWFSDSFDCHFTNCSFDFNRRVWVMNKGYRILTMTGGHIEEVYSEILLVDNPSEFDSKRPITIVMNGVSLLLEKRKMFKGGENVHLSLNGIEYRQLVRNINTAIDNSFLIDDRITLRSKNITYQHRTNLPQGKLNNVYDSTFKKETLGIKDNVNKLTNFNLSGENIEFEIVESDSVLGGNALKVTGIGANAWGLIFKEKIKANPGDNILLNAALKHEVLINSTARIDFYNKDNERIVRINQDFKWLGTISHKLNEWYYPDYCLSATAPKETDYYNVSIIVNGASLTDNTAYITGIYSAIL